MTWAATSYSVNGLAMLPFYIYESIFGFQRGSDQIWAAADQRTRGFLLGATSGRTRLGGDGLQPPYGTSHLVAATIPNCKADDPAFAWQLAVIIDQGMREMMVENCAQPDLVAESEAGIIRECYKSKSCSRPSNMGYSPKVPLKRLKKSL